VIRNQLSQIVGIHIIGCAGAIK